MTSPSAPNEMPAARRLFSQSSMAGHPESPPKWNPTKGLMKPSARAGDDVPATSAAAATHNRSACFARKTFLSAAVDRQNASDVDAPKNGQYAGSLKAR